MSEVRFTVPGPVVPWKRTASYGSRRLTPKRQREYQRLVRFAALASRAQGWPTGERYVLRVDVYEPDAKRRDLDNCAKTVSDALNGALWDDDSQVDLLVVGRLRDRANPRVEVHVRALHPDEQDGGGME